MSCLFRRLARSSASLCLATSIVAFETVAKEAEQQGKLLRAHTAHMIAHGFLHLIGYDHETAAEAERMEALERKIAIGAWISRPLCGRRRRAGRRSELNKAHVDAIR